MVNDLTFDFLNIPGRERIGGLPKSYLPFNRTGEGRRGKKDGECEFFFIL